MKILTATEAAAKLKILGSYPAQVTLVQEVFNAVFDNCESFREDNVGADLAYLLGAFVQDHPDEAWVDWSEEVMPKLPALAHILYARFPPNHPVWLFIKA